jgi:membrane protein required for colicin V production
MTLVDIVALAIVVISAIIAVMRGFVREVFSLIAWILAVVVAARFGESAAGWFSGLISHEQARAVTGFLVLFFVTLFLGHALSLSLVRLMKTSGLRATDRSLGLVFGVLRGVVIVGVAVMLLWATPLREHKMYTGAALRPLMVPVATFLHRLLPDQYGGYFAEARLDVDQIRDRAIEAGSEALDTEAMDRKVQEILKGKQ